MSDDDSALLPEPRKFIRENPVWVLGLAPFALVAINLLTISNGDPEVYGYLLQNLSVSAIVLGVVLPVTAPAIV